MDFQVFIFRTGSDPVWKSSQDTMSVGDFQFPLDRVTELFSV